MLPFNLNIISLDRLIPVEKPQAVRIEMIKREYDRTGHLATPLLVWRVDSETILLMHGTNSYFALKEMNINSAVVQEINPDDNSARFLSWYHLVRNYKPEHLLDAAGSMGLRIELLESLEDFDQTPADKNLLGIFIDSNIYRVIPERGGLIESSRALNTLIESYQACCTYIRIFPDKTHIETGELLELGSVLFLLPRYSRDEIISLAEADLLFPPDWLNIAVENRVVGLDFPIRVLNSHADVAEKREFLKQLIKLRIQSDRSTVYGARVYFLGRSPESSGKAGDSFGEQTSSGAFIE